MAAGRRLRAHFLLRAGDGRLLVDTADGALRLPAWEPATPHGWNEAAPPAAAAAELLGARAPVLSCYRIDRPSEDEGHAYFDLEPPVDAWTPPEPLAWAEPTPELLARFPAHEGAVLEGWLQDGRADPAVAAWAQPGWLDAATAWLDEQLARRGERRTGPVEQLRVWSISTVLRAPTGGGDVYLKSVPPLFAAEPPLTRELAGRHPGRVPEVLALDEERRLLLLAELPAGTTMSELEPAGWEEAVREYARIQLAWRDAWPHLRALGCPDRRLDALERELAPALRDLPSMRPGEPHGLADEELDALPELEETLRAACVELRAAGLPDTLDHGDLHAGNVRVTGDGPVFFDWTDGCLTVPFFSLVPLLEDVPEEPAARLRDAYLDEWEPHLAPGDHAATFELAQLVGLFHLLVSYRRILAGIDPRDRWQWRQVVPYLARQLLQRVASG